MSSRQFTDPLELRHAATDRATIVVVPERTLLAIDGVGSPDADDFWFSTDLLRKVGESLRSHLHRALSIDTRVSVIDSVWRIPPEVLADEIAAAFADRSG